MVEWVWWILFLPLISFLVVPLVPEKKRVFAGWIAFGSMLLSFLLTLKLAWPLFSGEPFHALHTSVRWISIPALSLELGLLIDSLSILMLLVVTGVGSIIFYYSLE